MYKLQMSCIIIVCFLFLLFLMEKDWKKQTRKLFAAIMVVSMLQIIFEILAIYTIQYVETVHPVLFLSAHRAYLTCVLSIFYLNFQYMQAFLKEEIALPKKGQAFMNMAQVILYATIFLLPLGYTQQNGVGEFAPGPGVWAVYVGAAFYLFVIFSNYCAHSRIVVSEKIMPLVFGVGCGMCITFLYMCLPETNITCLAVAIINIALYLSIRHDAGYKQEAVVLQDEIQTNGEESLAQEEIRIEETQEREYYISFEAPKAKVLVVDDSDVSRRILSNLLQKTQMKIEEAESAKQCLERLEQTHYDLIFMDHLMPEMDGVEALEEIRKRHICDDTPIAVLTANTTGMKASEYKKAGFAAYISKPVIPEAMETSVYEMLDKSLITSAEKKEIKVQGTSDESVTQEKEEDTKNWQELPMLDGLDYNYAALHFTNSDEWIDTIRFLVDVMPADISELEKYYLQLCVTDDCSNFRTKVHSMKNSVMTIGIVPLAGLAKTLEDAAKEENKEHINALMPVFSEKWEAYRMLLREKFGQEYVKKLPGDVSSAEVKELFALLRQAADDMDIDELDRIMNEIDVYVFPQQYHEKLERIRLAVRNFDIDFLKEEGYLV